jgi:hypothetical protein
MEAVMPQSFVNTQPLTDQQPQTPQLYLQDQLQQTRSLFSQQEQNLLAQYKSKRITAEQHQQGIRQIQQQVDEVWAKHQNTAGALKRLEQLAASGIGGMTPEKYQQAAWEMILPKEMSSRMFAEPDKETIRAPFAPERLQQYKQDAADFATMPGEMVDRKWQAGKAWFQPKVPWKRDWKTPGSLSKQALIKQYKAYRDWTGYDDPHLTLTQRAQIDHVWDQWMAETNTFGLTEGVGKDAKTVKTDAYKNWNPADPDVQALRSTGPLSQSYYGVSRTPMLPSDRANPLQQHIASQVPKQPKILDQKTIDKYLEEAGGDWQKAAEIAKSEGYKF